MLLLRWGKKVSFIDCYELEHGYSLSTNVRNESLSLKILCLYVQEEVRPLQIAYFLALSERLLVTTLQKVYVQTYTIQID